MCGAMKTKSKMTVPFIFGLWWIALIFMPACSPGTRHSGDYLDTAEHHVQSGMKLLNLSKYDDAMREFALAKDLDASQSGAYVGSGLVLGHKGDFSKGIQHMDKALKTAKNDQERVDAYVGMIKLYTLGKASASPDWLERAEAAYEAAINARPESPAATYYMGEAYRQGMELERASQLFERVLDIDAGYVRQMRESLNLIQKTRRETRGL